MIYLASPYTNPDPLIMNYRYQHALSYTAKMLSKGLPIFSPIVYGHQFVPYGATTDHIFWLNFNTHMLRNSTLMAILTLPGWEDSIGIKEEIDIANKNGITIQHVEDFSENIRHF